MNDEIRTYRGSVSIITGGASGIGRAIGSEHAKRGAQEIVICDVQTTLAEQAAEDFRRDGSGRGPRATPWGRWRRGRTRPCRSG